MLRPKCLLPRMYVMAKLGTLLESMVLHTLLPMEKELPKSGFYSIGHG